MPRIARILKSNGTDGGILIGVRDIEISEIDLKEPVYIDFDGLPVPFFILDLQRKGRDKAVIHLNDVCSLQDAEEITGRWISIEGEWEENEEEEDLTGWTVFDSDRKLGEITGMEPIPGNLCIYVRIDGQEVMIPLHEDFIIEMVPDSKVLRLDLPEGLY